MHTALRTTTTVLSGGRVEIMVPQSAVNALVEVIVLFPTSPELFAAVTKRSALEILMDAPGHRIFKTATEVEMYLTEEHNTWDN